MSLYEFFVLLHIILFCYWLGSDLAVFYTSNFVVNPSLSRETRLTTAKIMFAIDLIPRICMSLMLTVGGILTIYNRIEHPLWQILGIVLLGPFWLSLVLILHFRHSASFIPTLTRFDFYFRWIIIISIVLSCLYSISTGRLDATPWITAKLLGFAFLIFCGLMIRVNLKDFSHSYLKIINDTLNDEDNQIMIRSLKKVKPWVLTIWLVLILEAALGIAKPGDQTNLHLESHNQIKHEMISDVHL